MRDELVYLRQQKGISLAKLRQCPLILALDCVADEAERMGTQDPPTAALSAVRCAVDQLDQEYRDLASNALNFPGERHADHLGARRSDYSLSAHISASYVPELENKAIVELAALLESQPTSPCRPLVPIAHGIEARPPRAGEEPPGLPLPDLSHVAERLGALLADDGFIDRIANLADWAPYLPELRAIAELSRGTQDEDFPILNHLVKVAFSLAGSWNRGHPGLGFMSALLQSGPIGQRLGEYEEAAGGGGHTVDERLAQATNAFALALLLLDHRILTTTATDIADLEGQITSLSDLSHDVTFSARATPPE